jgi:hypothetical protein
MATGTLKMWKADRGFGFIKGRLWRFGYVSPHQRAAIGGKGKGSAVRHRSGIQSEPDRTKGVGEGEGEMTGPRPSAT